MENNPIVGATKTTRKLIFSLTTKLKCPVSVKYARSVISLKMARNVAIHNILKVAWSKYESMSITNLNENMILIEFEKLEEKLGILDGNYFKSLNDIEFERIQFLIQILGLELGVLTTVNTRQIGEGIGKCIKI